MRLRLCALVCVGAALCAGPVRADEPTDPLTGKGARRGGRSGSAPRGAPGSKTCFFSVDRPQTDPARWSAQCGAFPAENGFSVNRLDVHLPICGSAAATGTPDACFDDPDDPVPFVDVRSKLPVEGRTLPPKCYPPGRPRWVRLGHAMFDRSCFRGLPDAERGKLRKWTGAQPPFFSDPCRLNKFGELGVNSKGDPLRIPEHVPWAKRFEAEYPPIRSGGGLGTAAESIYSSYKAILGGVNGCLEALNPDLAERVRQAMGVRVRPGTMDFFRPTIECAEQLAFECEADQETCDAESQKLLSAYRQSEGEFEDAVYTLRKKLKCRPAHEPGTMLGSIDAANLKPGAVAAGSPRIQLFNATALFGKSRTGPSTLFHEFLHAAGAISSAHHNHGTEENVVPAGDEVYACQAIVFEGFFEKLGAHELEKACLGCAEPSKRYLCKRGKKGLAGLGCRI